MVKRTLQVIIAVGLLSPLVFGEVKTFIWTPPTQRTDDTPLLDSEIKEYELHCNSGLEVIIKNEGYTSMWTSQEGDFEAGFYTCWLHAVDTKDQHSPDSNNVDFAVQVEFEVKPKKGSGCT